MRFVWYSSISTVGVKKSSSIAFAFETRGVFARVLAGNHGINVKILAKKIYFGRMSVIVLFGIF